MDTLYYWARLLVSVDLFAWVSDLPLKNSMHPKNTLPVAQLLFLIVFVYEHSLPIFLPPHVLSGAFIRMLATRCSDTNPIDQ